MKRDVACPSHEKSAFAPWMPVSKTLSQLSRPRTTTLPLTNVVIRRPSLEMSGRSPVPIPGHDETFVDRQHGLVVIEVVVVALDRQDQIFAVARGPAVVVAEARGAGLMTLAAVSTFRTVTPVSPE